MDDLPDPRRNRNISIGERVGDLLYFPTINMLYSTSADSTVRSWSLNTLDAVNIFEGHDGYVCGITYQPSEESTCLYSGGDDCTIKLWNEDIATCIHTFKEHTGPVNGLTSSSSHLYSASTDGTIRVWDLLLRTCVRTFVAHEDGVWSLTLFSDGRLATSGGDGKIRLWANPVLYVERTVELSGHTGCVTKLIVSGGVLFPRAQT